MNKAFLVMLLIRFYVMQNVLRKHILMVLFVHLLK